MISVILATRERPHNIERLWKSVLDNTTTVVEFVFAVDSDDQATAETLKKLDTGKMVIKTRSGPRDYVPLRINESLQDCTGDVVALWGDDLVVRTQDWNLHIEEAIRTWADGVGLVYCRDDRHNEELCTHPFISRRFVDTLGYAAYDRFFHYYVDTWLHDIAKRINRLHYLPEVFIQHLHCDRKQAPVDNVYLGNYPYFKKDQETFAKDEARRQSDSDKLLKTIGNSFL